MKNNVNKMVKLAMLAAIGTLLMIYARFPIIPSAPFLKYEPGDIPALIATFLYGPIPGLIVTFIISTIQALTVDADSGIIGAIMHIIATGTLVIMAGLIYRKFHSLKGAILGLTVGSICMTLIMIPLNLFFTTKFLGVPLPAVKAMILPAIVPFNLIKATANSVLTVMLYKSVSKVFKHEIEQNKVSTAK
ncbi:ECF transporter S component [Clostridiaceae bacterium M8S5]|nr:ECF transporter S component [Clostridiaceae bacterium M8S5]